MNEKELMKVDQWCPKHRHYQSMTAESWKTDCNKWSVTIYMSMDEFIERSTEFAKETIWKKKEPT
jgi:hypothetical protein